MSHQHGFPPPPPPPSEPSPGTPAGSYFTQVRRRAAGVQPPSITTNFQRTQGVNLNSPVVPSPQAQTAFPYSPSTPVASTQRTAGSALLEPQSGVTAVRVQLPGPRGDNMAQPYNPRQWSGHGSHLARSQQASPLARDTREVTGMEAAMPSPPPPYSPASPEATLSPRGIRPSPMLEQGGFVSSPLASESFNAVAPMASTLRQSPQPPMSPAFPPPPGQLSRYRERSASGQRLFNTIQSLTSRGKQPVSNEVPAGHAMSYPVPGEDNRPPAARRAASTGHMYPSNTAPLPMRPTAGPSTGRSSPEAQWQPGMPLPGPPPGLPPTGARAQSLNRYPTATSSRSSASSSASVNEQQPVQRRAAQPSSLGPVPPTPADWVEDQDEEPPGSADFARRVNETVMPPLRIDTGAHREASLTRRPAQRDASAQGIRERRSKSRASREPGSNVMSPVSDDSRPSDLLLSTVEGSISQRREHLRKISGYASVSAYANAIPQRSPKNEGQAPERASSAQVPGHVLTPPYTPAIGGQSASHSSKRLMPGSASSDRPISHLLHAPIDDPSNMPAPLSPARPSSSASIQPVSKLEAFHLQALERHRAFIEKEANATSDEERLELFATYLVHESRLRRDRYSTAYNAMAGDIVDMTRDMWRSYTGIGKRAVTPSTSMSSLDHTIPSWASDGRPGSAANANMPSSASSMGEFTPGTDASSMGDAGDLIERAERQWGEQFKPSLSPIPSMAVSTVPDEDDSRGRAPSRWWEKSDSGSVGKPDRIVKTLRETKYMGVTAATLQDDPRDSPDPLRSTPTPGTSSFALANNEYPPEKVGWHEGDDFNTPMATPAKPGAERKPSNSGTELLDISRLITLPPPYPRHHPAVNNSHPLLSDLRTNHRQLADRTEIQTIQDAYLEKDFSVQRFQHEEVKARRLALRASIQDRLYSGETTFAGAAEAEASFDAAEAERGKTAARANFGTFEAAVSHPLNTLLTARLETANTSIGSLRADLETHGSASHANETQEEGDERPERLEKLTLLKWLFEAREGLHKEMFELHAQRGEKYAEVILTPYRLGHQQAKLDEAEAFFAKDSKERQAQFAREAAKRYAELEGVVEWNVSRGVEDQLSAFWDIAPGLLGTVQLVPCHDEEALGRVEVMIPPAEYDENPGLREWPLQYLYSLLSHAEKSAYQFIESQINLLCLLHEVRSARVKVEGRVEGRDGAGREQERLDAELKEKVGEVERLWGEALGEGLEGCKIAVREWLEARGGWVEGLEG
nr:hypothetical protein B0A51_11838 [Rachicladosporium sp. CCFEE 5018]